MLGRVSLKDVYIRAPLLRRFFRLIETWRNSREWAFPLMSILHGIMKCCRRNSACFKRPDCLIFQVHRQRAHDNIGMNFCWCYKDGSRFATLQGLESMQSLTLRCRQRTEPQPGHNSFICHLGRCHMTTSFHDFSREMLECWELD